MGLLYQNSKGTVGENNNKNYFMLEGRNYLLTWVSAEHHTHNGWALVIFQILLNIFFNAYVNYISNCNCAIRISLLMALCVRSIYLTERCLSAKTERQKHTWSSSAQSKGLPIIIGINPFHSHLFIFGKGCIRSHSWILPQLHAHYRSLILHLLPLVI